jgi:predicted DNA-binding transcriptional regulator
MNDAPARRLLTLFTTPATEFTLADIARRLDIPPQTAERAVRSLLRTGRLQRCHVGHGTLRYRLAAGPAWGETRPPDIAMPSPDGAATTLTARVLRALARHRAPLRAAEIVLLAGLGDEPRTVSRVSATLCMLARRGRVRRDLLPDGAVRYALPCTPCDARPAVLPRELIDAGFRPAIPREHGLPLALAEWIPAGGPARPSAATISQRLRRGWPPELASGLPSLRRQVA